MASLSRFVGNTLSFGAGALAGSQAGLRSAAYTLPRPMPHQFKALLDHPLRLRYRNPGETIGLFGITGGMSVLDLGCGTGLFTVEAAHLVGPTGTVHAADLQAALVEATRRRVEAAGVAERVVLHHSGAYNLPLADESVDLALLVAVLGEAPDRMRALAEVRRVLKPGGRLAVSEELPNPSYAPAGLVRGWAESVGFEFIAQTGSFFVYNMVFRRP